MNAGRTPYQGVATVVRFNWPIYLTAGVILVIGTAMAAISSASFQVAGFLMAAGALWFLVGSLTASHLIYDRSDLYRWKWLAPIVPAGPCRLIVCHTGFDEVSASLHQRFPDAGLEVFDHYDPSIMTEASIRRARAAHPPQPDTLTVPFNRWPATQADLILAPLSIHEFRHASERQTWFREARNSLNPGGRIVVVEHLRDPANFLAFGPGFVHFHSAATWLRDSAAAGLQLDRSFRLTPFLRVFIFQ